jgi:hypothetical protein
VVAVLMAMRSSPFREWDIVYYDPQKTNTTTLEKRLHESKCPNARTEPATTAEAGGIKLGLQSPAVVAGDWAWLLLEMPSGRSGRLKVTAPAGWKLAGGNASWNLPGGASIVPVAIPRGTIQGDHVLTVSVQQSGGKAPVSLSVKASVVRWVPGS